MTRLRRRLLLTVASASLLLLAAVVSVQGQAFPAPDPERAFSFGDVDLNGKLTLDEFRDLVKNAPRLKNAPAKKAPVALEAIFRRLDVDQDGVLTIAEYRKIVQLRQGGGPFGKGAPGRRDDAEDSSRKKPSSGAGAEGSITPEQTRFFETKIRPVLMTKCAKCHSSSAEKLKAGLLVDSREGLRKGGDTGPAVVPGDLEQSLLITAIRYHDEDLRMPPKAKLGDDVVADFEAWVKMGAPDPRAAGRSASAANREVNREKGRKFWAFQPPRSSQAPKVQDVAWAKSDIDRFLLAALEAKGLHPVADADRYALIRRVSFDLVGLPPAPEEVEAFVTDRSEDAFAKVVDRLLESPRFGERWGRHWLDVARYAESSGKANMVYSQAWRYRDWVIGAFNADMPYDQFVERQIAGDLLAGKDEHERAERVIATGFLAIGSKAHNTRDRKQFLLDLADEQIDTTSQAFLGLTVACARCHDHKFDPISQRDYYALSGIFQSSQTCYGTLPGLIQNINPSQLIELPRGANLPAALPKLTADRRKGLETQVAELTRQRDNLTPDENFTIKGFQTRARLAMLRFRLLSFEPDGTPRSYTMGMRERYEPIDSPLYVRGEIDQPAELVPRGIVQVLSQETPPTISGGSGRLELARWLTSRENPLTARVMVNRVWLHLFGRGLVASADNFGASGQPPSHPELLDTLAVSFVEQKWSVKRLIRQVVLSRAYQLASSHDARNFEVDPDNALVWRMSPRRLEAEALRDAVLSISGKLNVEPPVGSAVAVAGEGLIGPYRNPMNMNPQGPDMHRTVYLPVVRDLLPETLVLFDFADPSLVTGERATTSGPSQALFLMNSPFLLAQSEAAAARVREILGGDDARIKGAYLRFLARTPDDSELERARVFVRKFTATPAGESGAWTAFCQALYASAEFRYLD